MNKALNIHKNGLTKGLRELLKGILTLRLMDKSQHKRMKQSMDVRQPSQQSNQPNRQTAANHPAWKQQVQHNAQDPTLQVQVMRHPVQNDLRMMIT